jgi:hypothetical protein
MSTPKEFTPRKKTVRDKHKIKQWEIGFFKTSPGYPNTNYSNDSRIEYSTTKTLCHTNRLFLE